MHPRKRYMTPVVIVDRKAVASQRTLAKLTFGTTGTEEGDFVLAIVIEVDEIPLPTVHVVGRAQLAFAAEKADGHCADDRG
jgi:hypothetical protein